jgi:hypothetical protein
MKGLLIASSPDTVSTLVISIRAMALTLVPVLQLYIHAKA